MWTPFKELHHTVEAAVLRKQPDAIQDLEKILKKHKPDFLSLLQNPVSSKLFFFQYVKLSNQVKQRS